MEVPGFLDTRWAGLGWGVALSSGCCRGLSLLPTGLANRKIRL